MDKKVKFIPKNSSRLLCILLGCIALSYAANAQDTTKSILDINNSKIVKKVNALLDSNQKKINKFMN